MRFSVSPRGGDNGFMQWHDAMKMVARLPGGIPADFRKRLWLTMAEKHLQSRHVDWEQVKRMCFNERSNPDDDELGTQIVKDLHRTGCSLFCGEDAQPNQALLKRVLLAYARWNKVVGYCQGFNMLAALILEVSEWCDENALKIMIYLIEGVLPESYFANNLRGLSVDMAVFRDLLRLRLPNLSRHLDSLQADARENVSGASYEPPLTNVFTMQWFLTLFSNCLPKTTVLRVWDLIFLEGNEVLLRTALAIWDGLADRIMTVESADEFYSIMRVLTREMLEFGLMDANHLVKTVCSMAPFPFPQLAELRDKYTYNITPFTAALGLAKRASLHLFHSDDEDEEDEQQIAVAAWCFSSVLPHQMAAIKAKGETRSSISSVSSSGVPTNFTALGPGAFGPSSATYPAPTHSGSDNDRMSLDISALKKQYTKLRERQKQAHIILTAARNSQLNSSRPGPVAVNHLLVGKLPLTSKRGHLHKGTVRLVMQNKPSKKEVTPRVHKVSTPSESGQTLPWAMAKEERRLSLQDVDLIRLDRKKKDSDDGSSSSSTELCDDDDQEPSSDLDQDDEKLDKISSKSSPIKAEIYENILKVDLNCDDIISDSQDQDLAVTPLGSPCSEPTSGPDGIGFSSDEDLKWSVHEDDLNSPGCANGYGSEDITPSGGHESELGVSCNQITNLNDENCTSKTSLISKEMPELETHMRKNGFVTEQHETTSGETSEDDQTPCSSGVSDKEQQSSRTASCSSQENGSADILTKSEVGDADKLETKSKPETNYQAQVMSSVVSNHCSPRHSINSRRNLTLSQSSVSANDEGDSNASEEKTKNLVGNISLRSPTMPITFNPFPTSKRSPSKLPNEVGIKLGMYGGCTLSKSNGTNSSSSNITSKSLSPLKKKFFWY